ncbi:MAG TPA: chemotaxis protein CheW, partial [Lacipirellulaceae bacterium]|nr:chemotaxis protein CheW [Lacipirellulaceae bacterium]
MGPTTHSFATGQKLRLQLATFYLGEHCLALDIAQIQEIVRDVAITRVPDAPQEVTGVINLRGDVATIIDLRRVLGLPSAPPATNFRTLIVRSQGESIGLIVDRVADIMSVDPSDVVPAPPNVGALDGEVIRGVCPRESELIVVLDLERLLSSSAARRNLS